mmetsp:Transcript_63928/g.73333  ORF Transcript_63928/g.73333 Transcript_63928/m.73333 type:complete len:80 (+) Transcript_63928:202-441(+)
MGFGFGPNRKLETCGIKVFFSRYMPSWEPETRQQIKEDNFSAEFDLFSEYDRLLEDPSLRSNAFYLFLSGLYGLLHGEV